jgi:hypothetical protein
MNKRDPMYETEEEAVPQTTPDQATSAPAEDLSQSYLFGVGSLSLDALKPLPIKEEIQSTELLKMKQLLEEFDAVITSASALVKDLEKMRDSERCQPEMHSLSRYGTIHSCASSDDDDGGSSEDGDAEDTDPIPVPNTQWSESGQRAYWLMGAVGLAYLTTFLYTTFFH